MVKDFPSSRALSSWNMDTVPFNVASFAEKRFCPKPGMTKRDFDQALHPFAVVDEISAHQSLADPGRLMSFCTCDLLRYSQLLLMAEEFVSQSGNGGDAFEVVSLYPTVYHHTWRTVLAAVLLSHGRSHRKSQPILALVCHVVRRLLGDTTSYRTSARNDIPLPL